MDDTIFALSSGLPPAAIAVIRVSGPRAGEALRVLAGRLPPARRATLARLREPQSGQLLDEALVLWLPGPQSETGEDTVELHLHGGRAVVAAVAKALGGLHGFRPAEAGEFTRRAFEHGRIDLTAAEGLADLVRAETEAQRRQAQVQASGIVGRQAEGWRSRLVEAIALVEAAIDFPDEGDVPDGLVNMAVEEIRALVKEIGQILETDDRGERLRDGLRVAIVGPPNAGKSSLLNRIAKRDVAIVTPYAGTTRDVIEVHLDLGGFPITVWDTAGLREAMDLVDLDPVEQEGIRRARERQASADLVLMVWDTAVALTIKAPDEGRDRIWLVRNKIDTLDSDTKPLSGDGFGFETIMSVSALTGAGCDQLIEKIKEYAQSTLQGGESMLIVRQRHRAALAKCHAALARALDGLVGREELLAEELRVAASELGRISGRVGVEDILDAVFAKFCIGK